MSASEPLLSGTAGERADADGWLFASYERELACVGLHRPQQTCRQASLQLVCETENSSGQQSGPHSRLRLPHDGPPAVPTSRADVTPFASGRTLDVDSKTWEAFAEQTRWGGRAGAGSCACTWPAGIVGTPAAEARLPACAC